MDFNLNSWMTNKRHGDVLVEHAGEMTLGYIDSMVSDIETKLRESALQTSKRKKIFHVFVECAQNLYHHTESITCLGGFVVTEKLGSIVMSKTPDTCQISTGNFIHRSRQSYLMELLDTINSKNQEEINDLYLSTMSNQEFSDKGGAGLGMIDMARKSGNKLDYQFYTVKDDPDLLFFSLDVKFNN